MIFMFDNVFANNNNNSNHIHHDNKRTRYWVWKLTNKFIISQQRDEYYDTIELSNELIH